MGCSIVCSKCQSDANLKGLRARTVTGLLGPMVISRHYYYCPDCGHGEVPRDDALQLDGARQTLAAKEVIALTGAVDSFGEAADALLTKLTGVRVSESTVRRVTETIGEQIGQAQASEEVFGPPTEWLWHKDAEGKTVGYVSVDATGLRMQGLNGAKADGRMITVGMVYNPIPDQTTRRAQPKHPNPPWQARYVTALDGLDELADPLRRQAGQVGMDKAQRWVALSDGGAGLEAFLLANFPRVEVVILDFYHASEYLGEIGRGWHPGDEEGSKEWTAQWAHDLKHTGGAAVLGRLKDLATQNPPSGAREALQKAITYFENQVHRMDYPTYREKGWYIGSGPIESACKSVIGTRMKQAGMRWGTDGADSIGHIRALFRGETGQWDAYFSHN